jgi:hypothetical protein
VRRRTVLFRFRLRRVDGVQRVSRRLVFCCRSGIMHVVCSRVLCGSRRRGLLAVQRWGIFERFCGSSLFDLPHRNLYERYGGRQLQQLPREHLLIHDWRSCLDGLLPLLRSLVVVPGRRLVFNMLGRALWLNWVRALRGGDIFIGRGDRLRELPTGTIPNRHGRVWLRYLRGGAIPCSVGFR